jgi:copper chaperone NosL
MRFRTRIKILPALCIAFLLLMTFALEAAEITIPGPSDKDKCPVCGMFVKKYPDWTTVILFNNGSRLYFDGAKDMFKYLFDMKRYDSRNKKEDIRSIAVKDYYRLSWIDAHSAWFVGGSDVYGPMGLELIPLAKEADAKEFMTDHKGKRILKFPEITREIIKTLD